jgi:hypothetical protein
VSERIEEIRETLESYRNTEDERHFLSYSSSHWWYLYTEHVVDLLQRVEELERQNAELQREADTAIEYRRAEDW